MINAERYERSGDRKGYRSGHYDRNFTTTSGYVTLHVPKLKGIQFETAIIELYRRRETSIEEALIEMYLAGVYLKRNWGGEIQNVSVLVAIGVNQDGYREILGAAEGMKVKLKAAAKKVEDSIEETLTFMDFPSQHWTRIRTNNTLERLNREIKRRTKAIGAFPDGNSALMLVCARLRHVAGTDWGLKQ